ncbi:hypothetical protein CLV35_0841 [Motilibacter peucedani]|uniref:Uncharacterized protein n=1 Tax=Motilibacter peucedani TaxID=598650 RepID=A0A420XUI1_9ACTN|nr:hypothetical protein [Motilibacter peucedani]RKS80410.1 hypothetical protein CLV35_0841 [Motilibacter peucedani]
MQDRQSFPRAVEAGQHQGSRPGPTPVSRRAFLGGSAAAAAAVGLSLGTAAPASAASARSRARHGETPFGPVTVFDGPGASYARAIRLGGPQTGTARTTLATFQQFSLGSPGGFPVYRSEDDGRTWHYLSTVGGEEGRIWLQPSFYELQRPFGGLPQGAILCAGNSLDFNSTRIVLWASTDRGKTWSFLSTVAEGGAPRAENGFTPVWEPFLLLHRSRLICYYSDQRDPLYGQKLAHQTTKDLRTWGPVVNDAVGTDYAKRPGMTTVAKITNHLWIMTYEYGVSATYYPVHYKLARDPEEFDASPSIELLDQDGHAPASAPTVSWADYGGKDGTIIVSCNDDVDFVINRAAGDPGAWERMSTPMPRGYSRFTIPLTSPSSWSRSGGVFVITGAPYGEQAPITAGVIQLP